MSWILDIAAVVVAVVFLILGVRRGFIKSAIRLIGLVVSLCVAGLASAPLAAWLFDSFLHEPLHAMVAEQAASSAAAAAQTVQEQVTTVMEALPTAIKSAFDLSGMLVPASGAAVAVEPLTRLIMDDIVRPLCLSILQALLFLVLFIVLFLLVQWIGKGVNKIFTTLPLIRQINGALGGALGLLEGVAIVYLLTLVLKLYMTMSGASSVITTADIEATYVLQPIMEFSWFR